MALVLAMGFSYLACESDSLETYASEVAVVFDQLDAQSELRGDPYVSLAVVSLVEPDIERAEEYSTRAMSIFQQTGQLTRIPAVLSNLGLAHHTVGDHRRGVAKFEEALALSMEYGNQYMMAVTQVNLAFTVLVQGEVECAADLLRSALPTLRELGDRRTQAESLLDLAGIASVSGAPQQAVRLLSAVQQARSEIGVPLEPDRVADHERIAATARAALQQAEWVRAWDAGAALSLEEAIAEALDVTKEFGSSSSTAVTD